MRFAIAVAVAALAQLLVWWRVGDWVGGGAVVALAYVLFAALGAGYFAGRRAALAGGLSVFVGALAYSVASYVVFRVGDIGSLLDWMLRLALSVIPYAAGGLFAGALGGWLRVRTIRRA